MNNVISLSERMKRDKLTDMHELDPTEYSTHWRKFYQRRMSLSRVQIRQQILSKGYITLLVLSKRRTMKSFGLSMVH